MSADNVVIPLQVLRARQADAMSAPERVQVRQLLGEFGEYRRNCPTAMQETSDTPAATSERPLTANELRAVRTMLAEFEAIKDGCPVARRVLAVDR